MGHLQNLLIWTAGLLVITLASKEIGQAFARIKLPLISGFLFAGILVGPFGLDLISAEATANLRFVDEISLGFIAFAAGSELYLKELRSRFKSITWVTAGLVVSAFSLGSLAVLMLADFIPFMQDMPATIRIAVAILAGAILVARSPSSAIAIINELRARGPFTQMVLGVTVIMDVVVIVLFSINSSVADALLTNIRFDALFIILLIAELLAGLSLGYLLSKVLQFILSRHLANWAQSGLILLAGYGAFFLSEQIRTRSHELLSFEILLEPLLICMIAGFLVANRGSHRSDFLQVLHDVGPPIYVVFFTLTGASLALDILARTWPIALTLFVVRLTAIFIGSYSGGTIAGDPARYNRVGWMAFVTQAGVGLGLAKEVAAEFPQWGAAFATIIISVIVLNQIVGPPLFKWAINLIGEAHMRAATPEFDGVRDALIFGLEGQSFALARQLKAHGWQVKIATRKAREIDGIVDSDVDIQPIADLSLRTLHELDAGKAETIVTMLSDEENLHICELAYEHFGTRNLVVRMHDSAAYEQFQRLGARAVFPAAAFVSLLDHFVRSPAGTSLLLGMEEDQDVIDVEVRNPDLHGLRLHELRLPLDALVLSINRDGHVLISHGYTRLELGDVVTVIGSLESLEEIMLHFGA